MRDNPFNQLIQFMREEGGYYNPPSILLAEVVTPSPLVIKIGDDLQIDKDNLKVADYLVANYEREIKSKGSLNVSATVSNGGSLSSLTVNNGKIQFTDALKAGDLLAVIPTEDRQTFIVLCRVVDV